MLRERVKKKPIVTQLSLLSPTLFDEIRTTSFEESIKKRLGIVQHNAAISLSYEFIGFPM